MRIDPIIEQALPTAVELRHRLHQIPELAYQEVKTAKAIRAELDRLGIEHVDGVPDAPTATVAWIGDTSKPCIALRADIDALPIAERSGLPYASTHPGQMHACGHDGHSATLAGVAAVLKQVQSQLPVCVKLLFQPAEEGGGGAERLVSAGVLDGRLGPKVQAVLGLHGWPGLKVGFVATKPGPLLAAVDNFTITIIGRGSHAAYPHTGRDPIVTAAELVLNLQQIASRDFDPTEPVVVTVAQVASGTAVNIIPNDATMHGTVRTLTPEARKLVRVAMQRRIEGVAAANDCQAKLTWFEGYPPTVNDSEMSGYVERVARQTLGGDRFVPVARPSMGGEDFAYYLEKVPGCFFLLGVEPPDREGYPALHTDCYDFTDAALGVGMRMFVALAMGFGV